MSTKKAGLTGAQRQAKLRERGLTITVTLLDERAIAVLEKLAPLVGGKRIAIEAALKDINPKYLK